MTQNTSSLTTKQRFQTDRFTLHQEAPGRWKVSGKDSDGNYRRIRFNALDWSQALTEAEKLLSGTSDQRIHISDALFRAAKDRSWTEKTRKKDVYNCEYFLAWIDKKGLSYWHELRYEHMLEYKRFLVDRECAYDTIRLYFQPIRRTSAWMSANWPNQYNGICKTLRVSQNDIKRKIYKVCRNPYLPIPDLLDFLDWMERSKKPPALIVGVALQGLAGLQMLEAIRLTPEKFDGSQGTIIIDGVVKNSYRIRKIPLPHVASWLIRKYGIIPTYSDHISYGKALHRAFHEWNPDLVIKPKDLRNTIQTAAIDEGWDSYFLDRYVGHAPNTIRRKHYFGDDEARLIPLMRENVVKHIEAEISKWNTPGDTGILPGPRRVVNL